MSAFKVTKENFEKEVLKETKTVMLDFWASWCGPCQMLLPIVESLAEEVSDKYKICKINVDEQPELAQQFDVMSIPTLVIMKSGKLVKRSVGGKSKEQLIEMLER